jgi:hypothetical protein
VSIEQVLPMSAIVVEVCQCDRCQREEAHPDRVLHQQMNLLLSRLGEAERRWYAAVEANRLGHGGARLVAQITGLDEKTIRRGQEEVAGSLADAPIKRQRRAGGGRPSVEKKIRPS